MLKQIDFTKLPITDIVNEIIYTAAEAGASDIHFDPTETTIRVRFRIDGVLIDYTIIPENIRKNLIARLKIISGMDITESRLPQDGAIKTTIKNINLDMRVSSLPTNEGEKIVIRILDYSASMEGLESLGFTPNNLRKMKELIKEPNGIILVTGATGSGKSTTVYSLLQLLNTPEVNLVTVEDPVEMNIDGINQIQVNSEVGLTFASVLRSILRQDPDIIMIGEIRDDETAKIAVRASITGHLVLSTIHTNNALNTIERLTDMDVERYLLASSLNGIVSQKLARRICPHCKKMRPAIDYEKKLFKLNLGVNITELAYAKGCSECVGGYKGRIAIHEVLVISQKIRDAIANGVSKENLRNLVYTKGGTTTMLQDGLGKVLQGITTIEEIIRIVELNDENTKIVESKDSNIDSAVDNVNIETDSEANNVADTVNTSAATNNVVSQPSPSTPPEPAIEKKQATEGLANVPITPIVENEDVIEDINISDDNTTNLNNNISNPVNQVDSSEAKENVSVSQIDNSETNVSSSINQINNSQADTNNASDFEKQTPTLNNSNIHNLNTQPQVNTTQNIPNQSIQRPINPGQNISNQPIQRPINMNNNIPDPAHPRPINFNRSYPDPAHPRPINSTRPGNSPI